MRRAPTRAAPLRAELMPMLDRFLPDHYAEYSPEERQRLHTALDELYHGLLQDSSQDIP